MLQDESLQTIFILKVGSFFKPAKAHMEGMGAPVNGPDPKNGALF